MRPSPPLQLAAAALPAVLAPSAIRRRVERTAAALALPAGGGFEVRLAAGVRPIDLCVHLLPNGREGTIAGFLERLNDAPIDPARRADWGRLRGVLAGMNAAPAAGPGLPATGVWLEFDLDADRPHLPLPGVFFDALDGSVGAPGRLGERLRGRPFSTPATSTIERCLAAVDPATERVCFHGFMLGRADDAMRLHLVLALGKALVRYARAIGWPGNGEWLAHEVAALARFASRFAVNVDVGEQVWPRLGVELFFDGPDRGERIAGLLAAWSHAGLATAEKVRGLLAWPATEWSPREGPAEVQVRSINHLKLTLHADGTREAKAYLSVRDAVALPTYPGRTAARPAETDR